MIEISEFYRNKSHSERKLKILEEIVECEKLLQSNDFSITGGGCMMISELGDVCSDIRLSSLLSDQCCGELKKVIRNHLERLKELGKQIDKEKEDED